MRDEMPGYLETDADHYDDQFANWKERLNQAMWEAIEMDIDDYPDKDYHVLFSDGYSPEAALQIVLEDEGFPFDD